jgi:hypothetical protein
VGVSLDLGCVRPAAVYPHLIGVATLYLALLVINATTVAALIPGDVLADEVGHATSANG